MALRAALPPALEQGARARAGADGAVVVSVRVPAVFPRWRVGTITARARFAPQRP
jgi:hypothetical protein